MVKFSSEIKAELYDISEQIQNKKSHLFDEMETTDPDTMDQVEKIKYGYRMDSIKRLTDKYGKVKETYLKACKREGKPVEPIKYE